jgi:hypothetical protein
MKVKARDIIAGWPRGRSTSVLSMDPAEKLLWLRWQNGLIGQPPPAFTPATRVRLGELAHLIGELIETIDYRASQQRMVDEYLERWRLDFKCPRCAVRSSSLFKFIGATYPTISPVTDPVLCPMCGGLIFCRIPS